MLKEIRARLAFLLDVGLDYLTLARGAATLAGGEAQRIRLATQIGSGLVGVLYILDEPSIGLHQRDNRRLIETLVRLRDLGNTVIVVEHDEETIRVGDHIVDIGPGAGEHGGRIVAEGDLAAIMAEETSITGDYLAGRRSIAVPGAAPGARRAVAVGAGSGGEQPQRDRCGVPPRPAGRGDRGLGEREEHAGRGDPQQGPAPGALRARASCPGGTGGSRGWSTSTRSSTSTSRPSGAPRAPTRPPTPSCSTGCASCSPAPPTPGPGATSRAASRSTWPEGAARPARATAPSASRCTSCPTSTSAASSARGGATTGRPWRSSGRGTASPTCSRCR